MENSIVSSRLLSFFLFVLHAAVLNYFPLFSLRQEKSHLKSEIEQLKDRYTQLSTAFDSANEDRVKLVEQVDELKRKAQKLQQERDAAHRNMNKDVSTALLL